MSIKHLTAFLASAAALFIACEAAPKLKQDSIDCIDSAIKTEFTNHLLKRKPNAKLEASRIFVKKYNDENMYGLSISWGDANSDLSLKLRNVEEGVLDSEIGDPGCLQEAQRRCVATLLRSFIPAATLWEEWTSIGKPWPQLVDAMRSTPGTKDDCSPDASKQFPPATVDAATLRSTSVACIQKLAKETISFRNAKSGQPIFPEGPDKIPAFVVYTLTNKPGEGRNYGIRIEQGEKAVRLFDGNTNPDIPAKPVYYTDRACEDLAIMRCVNQMLHHHAKPAELGNNRQKVEIGKTWADFIARLMKDNSLQCK